jgi:hypothetical protein
LLSCAGTPDAAKPQHFCLEVEARSRDESGFAMAFGGTVIDYITGSNTGFAGEQSRDS